MRGSFLRVPPHVLYTVDSMCCEVIGTNGYNSAYAVSLRHPGLSLPLSLFTELTRALSYPPVSNDL